MHRPNDRDFSIRLSNRDGSLDLAVKMFGDISADMFDEVPLTRALKVLEFCAKVRQNPPKWAVLRWANSAAYEIVDSETEEIVEEEAVVSVPRGAGRRQGGKPRRSYVVDCIRALAVENCSGTPYRRDEKPKHNKYERANELLAKRDLAALYCGLPVVASASAIRTSHQAVANPRFRGPHRHLGLKVWLCAHLPLLVSALEQKDTPIHPFVW